MAIASLSLTLASQDTIQALAHVFSTAQNILFVLFQLPLENLRILAFLVLTFKEFFEHYWCNMDSLCCISVREPPNSIISSAYKIIIISVELLSGMLHYL